MQTEKSVLTRKFHLLVRVTNVAFCIFHLSQTGMERKMPFTALRTMCNDVRTTFAELQQAFWCSEQTKRSEREKLIIWYALSKFPRTRSIRKSAWIEHSTTTGISSESARSILCNIATWNKFDLDVFSFNFPLPHRFSCRVWHYSTFSESSFVSAFIRLKRITHQSNNNANKWCKKAADTRWNWMLSKVNIDS